MKKFLKRSKNAGKNQPFICYVSKKREMTERQREAERDRK